MKIQAGRNRWTIRIWKNILLMTIGLLLSCSGKKVVPVSFSDKYDWEQPVSFSKYEKRLSFRIDTFFQNKVRHAGLNGCVLVADHGKILYQKCFGYSNYELKKPLDDSSTFQLASVTKPFTATAILMLYEGGQLDLDDPVSKFIPHFPYDSITIRMLLNHRSGLANYIYLFDTLRLADSFISNQQVVNYFVEHAPPLQSTPGHHFQYCNTNYALLAWIIEIAGDRPYADFLREKIFFPSHMYHTYVGNVLTADMPECETCDYRTSRWERISKDAYDGVMGDKGIYTTPRDLYMFDQALNHGLLLKKETLEEAYKGYSYEKPGIKNYGLGWRLKEFPNGEKLVYHNGWWHGYNTLFARRPDHGTCVIVLSNKYNRSTYNLGNLYEMLHMAGVEADDEDE